MYGLGIVEAAIAKRNASVPYFSIIGIGSMELPEDLLIFLPVSSATKKCKYTSRKGTSSIHFKPIIIIRATQKNRMSQAVTKTEVG